MGSVKANEHDIVTGIRIRMGFICKVIDIRSSMGRSMLRALTLLKNSVVNIIRKRVEYSM